MRRPRLGLWHAVMPLLLLSDSVAILLGLFAARYLRLSTSEWVGLLHDQPVVRAPFLMMLVFLWLSSLLLFRLYQRDYCVAGMDEYRRVFLASSTTLFGAIVLAYAIFEPLSRGFLLFAWTFVTFGLCLGRFAIRRLIYVLARQGRRLDRVLILGASKHGLAMAHRLEHSPSASTEVCGFLDEYRPVGQLIGERFRILGEPLDLWRIAARYRVTKAILVQSALTWESQHALIQRMHRGSGVSIILAPGMLDLNATPLEMRQLGPLLLAVPRPQRIVGLEAVLKRSLDLAIASALLLFSAPLILVCCWLRLRNGRWPIIRRPVIGQAGQQFSLMEINGSEWLRRSHLARLPSLFAVLSGKLSIVGPRPVSSSELPAYKEWAELLLSVRPGFIGPWWEGPPREPEEEIQLDVRYIQNYSAWLDVQVVWHSLPRLFRRWPAAAEVASWPAGAGKARLRTLRARLPRRRGVAPDSTAAADRSQERVPVGSAVNERAIRG